MSSLTVPITTDNVCSRNSIPLESRTSIVACEFQGGVIIGVDSQIITGEYINNRTADKLIKIDDFVYCSGSGPLAEVQYIMNNVLLQLQILKFHLGELSVLTVAVAFRVYCYNHRNNLNAEMVIVGVDNIYGGQVYTISSGGMMRREAVSVLGSGSLYLYGYIDAHFEENMSKTRAEEFVSKTLALAVARDCFSGGKIRIAVITKDEVERFVVNP